MARLEQGNWSFSILQISQEGNHSLQCVYFFFVKDEGGQEYSSQKDREHIVLLIFLEQNSHHPSLLPMQMRVVVQQYQAGHMFPTSDLEIDINK